MSKYSPIYQKIWKDKDFLKSSKDAKLIFLYLTTNDAIHISGIYEIPLSTIAYETGIPLATVRQVLTNGSIKNVAYDLENEMVFLVNRLKKYSQGGNPVQVEKGIITQFLENAKTPLWNLFVEVNPYYKTLFSTLDQPLPKGSLPLPLPLPLRDLTNNGTNSNLVDKNFDEDWERYPRKAGNRKKARECYRKSVGLDRREIFLAKMDAYVLSNDDPVYLKHGETFFRNWEDLEVGKPVKAKPKETSGSAKRRQIQELLDKGHGDPTPIRLLENEG